MTTIQFGLLAAFIISAGAAAFCAGKVLSIKQSI